MTVTLNHYLVVSFLLFSIGFLGVLIRRNFLIVLMSIELMLNAANLALVAFGRAHGSAEGQALALFVMAVAAAEVAVGLAIIVAIFRRRRDATADDLRVLRG